MVEHLLPKHLRLCTRAPYLSWRALERGVIGCGPIRLMANPLARHANVRRERLRLQVWLSELPMLRLELAGGTLDKISSPFAI